MIFSINSTYVRAITVISLTFKLAGCGLEDELPKIGASGGQGSQSEIHALGGTRLSEQHVARLLANAGVPGNKIPTMVCVAKYESSLYSGATNRNSDGSIDIGLFQINDYWWPSSCGVHRSALFDPAVNARCAHKVLEQQGIFAWHAYTAHEYECRNYRLQNFPSGSSGSENPPSAPSHGNQGGQGALFCPKGFAVKKLTSGKMVCESSSGVLGPFPGPATAACKAKKLADCSSNVWPTPVFIAVLDNKTCLPGTWQSGSNICVDDTSAYGPFPATLVHACERRGGGNACRSQLWSRHFLSEI